MIKKATRRDTERITEMASLLWPDLSRDELFEEMQTFLENEDGAIFLAWEEEELAGFAQVQLRYDYVEGTETRPVGYLEGLFVHESQRRKGIARKLVRACEQWAKEKGCTEFGSDVELDNEDSYAFHLAAGFQEANRIICFAKKI